VAGERQQVQCGQHGRKLLLAVAEIVLQVVTLGFQCVEAFIRNRGKSVGAAAGQAGRNRPLT